MLQTLPKSKHNFFLIYLIRWYCLYWAHLAVSRRFTAGNIDYVGLLLSAHFSLLCEEHCLRWHLQWSKKETFYPETGPEFPQIDKNQKLCKTPTIIQWGKIDLPHINRKKYFACFGAESFSVVRSHVWARSHSFRDFPLEILIWISFCGMWNGLSQCLEKKAGCTPGKNGN